MSSLLDVPLSEQEPPADAAGAPPPPPPRRALIWIWALAVPLALVVGWAGGYLWPRPEPPVLTPSTTLVDFGEQRGGQESPSKSLEVENVGGTPLDVESSEITGHHAGDFRIVDDGCTGRPVPGDGSCFIELRFVPPPAEDVTPVADRRTASLRLRSDASNGPVSVPLVGMRVTPRLEAIPGAVDFGRRSLEEPAETVAVTVTNQGSARVRVGEATLEGEGAADFLVVSDACSQAALDPGEICRVRLTSTPRRPGRSEAVLRIASDASAEPLSIPVTAATGYAEPVFETRPEELDFADLRVGGPASGQTVTVHNLGDEPLIVRQAAVEPADSSFSIARDACTGEPVPPAASCEIAIGWRPSAEGPTRGELVLVYARPGKPEDGERRVPLKGRAVSPRLEAEPTRLELGPVALGQTRPAQTVRLTNAGTAPVTVERVVTEGSGRSAFAIDGSCSGETLAPGQGCELQVSFRPLREGPQEARLVVQPAGGPAPALTVPLAGTALPAPEPELAVEPSSLSFEDLPVGRRSGIGTVTVHNPGTARLELEGLRIEGPDASDFRLVPATCEGTPFLAAGGSCTVGVRFSPTAEGDRRARLVVRGNAPGGPETVILTGRGLEAENP